MTILNGLSDNQIRAISIRGEGGGSFDPNVEWLTIHLRCGERKFVCVNNGENSKNCHIDEDGKLVLDIPSRTFKKGVLEYMVEIREDSQYFKDGYKNTFSKEYKPTGIEIV